MDQMDFAFLDLPRKWDGTSCHAGLLWSSLSFAQTGHAGSPGFRSWCHGELGPGDLPRGHCRVLEAACQYIYIYI